jgi:pimeloyl-ACP methyl ester carboxylesterase
VLVVFGRDDPFLLAGALSDLPSLVTGPLTIKRIPGGHFVLRDAPRPVRSAVTGWLASQQPA